MPKQTKYVIQIMWHINDECSLVCRHCYRTGKKRRPIDRWDFQQLVVGRIAEFQEHYDIIRVGLLGGEPLLDPSLIKIILALRKKGISRIDISTNGILADQQMVENLREAGVKMIQVSLEGPMPEVNDYIRGEGSFKQAVKGLRTLVASGIETGIMMTVSRHNFPFIREMTEFAFNEGAKIISYNRLLPLGRGKTSSLQCLSSEEVREMIAMVHELDGRYSGMDVSSDDPLLYIPSGDQVFAPNAFGGCGAGVGNLAICHDGTVYPCRRLPIKVGDVKRDQLIDVINSSMLNCFYNRGESLKGKCKACQHIQVCGGCRAAAYAFTGDFHNSDPQCHL